MLFIIPITIIVGKFQSSYYTRTVTTRFVFRSVDIRTGRSKNATYSVGLNHCYHFIYLFADINSFAYKLRINRLFTPIRRLPVVVKPPPPYFPEVCLVPLFLTETVDNAELAGSIESVA